MSVNGHHYLVENIGYHLLTGKEVEAIKRLTSRDTSFGYDDMVKRNLLSV